MTMGNIFPSPDLGQYLNSKVIDGIRNRNALAFPSPTWSLFNLCYLFVLAKFPIRK